MEEEKVVEEKQWYASKTLWVNALAVLAIVLQGITGKAMLDTEAQVAVLALINVVLRAFTKGPVTLKKQGEGK